VKNPFKATRLFFGEMIAELGKATWPTRQELVDSTLVVLIAVALLGLFTGIADFSLLQLVGVYTKLVS
jgi:preprotein translocase subunit SecE